MSSVCLFFISILNRVSDTVLVGQPYPHMDRSRVRKGFFEKWGGFEQKEGVVVMGRSLDDDLPIFQMNWKEMKIPPIASFDSSSGFPTGFCVGGVAWRDCESVSSVF